MKWPEDFINQIICGDCLETMRGMPNNCIDTIITDPPYGLSFMGKDWDSFKNSRIAKSQVVKNLGTGMRQTTLQENINFMEWTSIWAKEALRILKPGGTMLCFAGSRTQHLVAFGIELAGWILKDCIMWLYGSGFPKASDISKQIDKKAKLGRKIIGKIPRHYPDGQHWGKPTSRDIVKPFTPGGEYRGELGIATKTITAPATPEATLWDGWKSHGLKPAYEPIIVAMKPNEGSYANNALKWGVAGLNIDGGRIGVNKDNERRYDLEKASGKTKSEHKNLYGLSNNKRNDKWLNKGRYPANVILECTCDEIVESKIILGDKRTEKKQGNTFAFGNQSQKGLGTPNYQEKALIHTDPKCPCYMLDEQSGDTGAHGGNGSFKQHSWMNKNISQNINKDNTGGASRFFYCAKASKAERNRGCEGLEEKQLRNYANGKGMNKRCTLCNGWKYGEYNTCKCKKPNFIDANTTKLHQNHHPTVKPLTLMKYLCLLTKTPTGGIVLDPFCGSGTTLIVCKELKRDYIGIDNNSEYCEIARNRVNAIPEPLF